MIVYMAWARSLGLMMEKHIKENGSLTSSMVGSHIIYMAY